MLGGAMTAQELFQELKHRIRGGELTDKLPSISEMIAAYRVSHRTVKKALDMLKMQQLVYGMQGKGVYVRGYAKQKKNDDRIYVYCDLRDLNTPFFVKVLDMLLSKAAAADLRIELISNFRDCENGGGRFGFIMSGAVHPEENLVLAKHFQYVLGINLSCNFPGDRHIYGCVNDNFYGGYKAVEYLYNRGHRHIGIAACGLDRPDNIFTRRARGAEQFASEHPDVILVRHNVSSIKTECGQNILADTGWLQENPQLTAIFAFTDLLAIKVMNRLNEMGRRIPEEVSIIGYDNAVFSGMLSPALTTIEENAEAMAEAVLTMIREHLAGRRIGEDILIKPEIIERASVRDIRSETIENAAGEGGPAAV